MTHAVAGFPDLKKSAEIVKMMSGIADIIEIQIPFSDPVADGPTMMTANEKSIAAGFRVDDAFLMTKKLSVEISTPILLMTYFNIVFCRGVSTFCRDAAAAGVSGLIVPDFPIDEESREHFFAECEKNHLAPILVVSPITPKKRLQKLAKYARGFWYAISRTGTTGARDTFEAGDLPDAIREVSDLPVALAFGISKSEHLKKVSEKAEMAVVGSATMNFFLRKEFSFEKNLADAEKFLRDLRET